MNIIDRQLQQNLNKVNKWARENEFKFSKFKTKYVHFCPLRNMYNVLKTDDSEIPVINEYKLLDVIFDKKTFIHPTHKISKKTNQPVPNNFCESFPTLSGELTIKL